MSVGITGNSSAGRRLTATCFVAACVIFLAGRAPFFGQWDSFDYLKQVVTHRLSDLGFGRPVFIGYNVLIWEAARRLFRLEALQVDSVVMAGMILTGAIGVLLFARLAAQIIPGIPARMATLALLLSPMYAFYSGAIMTEVPMIVATIGAASILWDGRTRGLSGRAVAAGVMFGAAVGIREQAITLVAAYFWILWVRRPDLPSRMRASLLFGISALIVIVAPIVMLYLYDPAWFFERTRIWLRAIPTGEHHLARNIEASLLYAVAGCPGVWLALVFAGFRRIKRSPRERIDGWAGGAGIRKSEAYWGLFCCLLLPLAVLWRDADVQIHPRYTLILLPSLVLFGTMLYCRLIPPGKAAWIWAVIQIVVFAFAQVAIQPFREMQREKREFSELARKSLPDSALILSGGYSPVFDYYRGIGEKPRWHVYWSGWGWDRRAVESAIRKAWAAGQPVYWCSGPYGWLYFEDEWLDLYFVFKGAGKEVVAPGVLRMIRP